MMTITTATLVLTITILLQAILTFILPQNFFRYLLIRWIVSLIFGAISIVFAILAIVLVEFEISGLLLVVTLTLASLVLCSYDLYNCTIVPLKLLTLNLSSLSNGNIEVKGAILKYEQRQDEIGQMVHALNACAESINRTSGFLQALDKGDFNYQCLLDNTQDKMGVTLHRLQDKLNNLINEISSVLGQAVDEGKLDVKIETEGKKGAWRNLSSQINELITSFSSPLKSLNVVIHGMADGDLTHRFENESKGEVLQMGENLNLALDNINGLLGQISSHANTIEESSAEMSTTGEEINASTDEIASAIAQMSQGAQTQVTKIDESSNRIENVLESAKVMGQKAEFINGAASKGVENSEKGIHTVMKLTSGMEEITDHVIKANTSMQVLVQRSSEIEQVLKVINGVAVQTNMLALNAAIEAAQAGDAGRGFAVVAEQIRTLAESSKESTKEIERLVTDVQADTQTAVEVMEKMNAHVKQGETSSQEVSGIFNDMFDSSNQTLELSEEILKVAHGQTESINHVVTNVEGVVVVAEQTAAGTEQVAASATELSSGMNDYNKKAIDLAHIASSLKEGLSMVRLSGNAEENTAIFRMREAFEHEKSLLDALLNHMPDTIYFKDLESNFFRVSQSLVEQFDVSSAEDIIGKSDFDFFGKHAQKAFDDEQGIIRTGEPLLNEEEKTDLRDGSVQYSSTTKLPLLDLEGNIIGTYGITRDITDRKLIEKQLEEKSKQIQLYSNGI
ncbi:methyl-accepting chemotaxis protein [Reichenbachiella sp.]|uniref:methyl-accepting chemotaxis protein n=1 Tax=Reichenbachiella sp. TaxID=2184521 RepID=UPI00329A39A4